MVTAFRNGDADGELIHAGAFAVAGDTVELGAGGLVEAELLEPVRALGEDARSGDEGFDIVHDGGIAHVTGIDREGRTVAGLAALSFERLDERGFLAADIRAGTHLDSDV